MQHSGNLNNLKNFTFIDELKMCKTKSLIINLHIVDNCLKNGIFDIAILLVWLLIS